MHVQHATGEVLGDAHLARSCGATGAHDAGTHDRNYKNGVHYKISELTFRPSVSEYKNKLGS